jgi:hypothetical protein
MSDFLKLERKYLVIDQNTLAIRFTEEGSRYYREWFARYGFDLERVKTLGDFLEVMDAIGTRLIEDAKTRLTERLREGKLKGNERLFAEALLRLDLEAMREARQNMSESRKMGENVIKLSFGRRRKTGHS